MFGKKRQGFSRETQELIEKNNWEPGMVCSHMGISLSTFYRWKKGSHSPSRAQFERLKKLTPWPGSEDKKEPPPIGGFEVQMLSQLLIAVGTANERLLSIESHLEKIENTSAVTRIYMNAEAHKQ